MTRCSDFAIVQLQEPNQILSQISESNVRFGAKTVLRLWTAAARPRAIPPSDIFASQAVAFFLQHT